jgi:hypothetical protein
MSVIANQPQTKSFLSQLGFKFTLARAPSINYFVQSASLPSITLNRVDVSNPFIKIPMAGDHLDFGEFTLTYKVDEDLQNYLEIYNWLIGIGFPDSFEQYKSIDSIRKGKNTGLADPLRGYGVFSDATLTILSSAMNPLHHVVFNDAFPTSLSELEFNTTDPDITYITSTVTFAYRKFSIESL